jgi:Holliday junction resolvase RusA-like endonuclease
MTQRGKWKKKNAQNYLVYKGTVGWSAKNVIRKPLERQVAVEIVAIYNGGRPGDLDNIVKAILDGCNDVVWLDDIQVVEIHAYRRQGQPERAEMKVWEIS